MGILVCEAECSLMDGRVHSWILSLQSCLCGIFGGYRFDPAFFLWLALQVAATLLLFPLFGTGVQCLQCERSSSGKILPTAEITLAFVFFLPFGLAVLEEQCLSIIGSPFIAR